MLFESTNRKASLVVVVKTKTTSSVGNFTADNKKANNVLQK